MSINHWLSQLSNQKFQLPFDGECILTDENANHYVTIKEQANQVIFIYSLPIENKLYLFKNALLLNANPSFLGLASICLGDQEEELVLTVFGQPNNYEEFETLWKQAQRLREITIECLEARW